MKGKKSKRDDAPAPPKAKKPKGDGGGSGKASAAAGTAAAAAAAAPATKRATLSIAVPASIITNALKPELKVMLAGQIARAATVFRVDEVVVYDDRQLPSGKASDGATFLARVLQYLETPPYLRKALIPMHSDLRLAGMLPALDAPHQPRSTEWLRYREGVVVADPNGRAGKGRSLVDVRGPSPRPISLDCPPPLPFGRGGGSRGTSPRGAWVPL